MKWKMALTEKVTLNYFKTAVFFENAQSRWNFQETIEQFEPKNKVELF